MVLWVLVRLLLVLVGRHIGERVDWLVRLAGGRVLVVLRGEQRAVPFGRPRCPLLLLAKGGRGLARALAAGVGGLGAEVARLVAARLRVVAQWRLGVVVLGPVTCGGRADGGRLGAVIVCIVLARRVMTCLLVVLHD